MHECLTGKDKLNGGIRVENIDANLCPLRIPIHRSSANNVTGQSSIHICAGDVNGCGHDRPADASRARL
jgi:hypothetical protein